jgi:hypothetical protein
VSYQRLIEKLKKRWGVGPWGVAAILVAFSLAGMTVVRITPGIQGFILPEDAPGWARWTVRLLVIVPVYQVLLLAYGTLLGQFAFFWEKEKAMVRWLGRAFARSPQNRKARNTN